MWNKFTSFQSWDFIPVVLKNIAPGLKSLFIMMIALERTSATLSSSAEAHMGG